MLGQASGDRRSLLLPTTELIRTLVQEIFNREELAHPIKGFLHLHFPDLVQAHRIQDVLSHGLVREECEGLGNVSHVPLLRTLRRYVLPAEMDGSSIGRLESEHDAQQDGLA